MSGERNRIYLCLAHMSGKEQQFIKEAFDTSPGGSPGAECQCFRGRPETIHRRRQRGRRARVRHSRRASGAAGLRREAGAMKVLVRELYLLRLLASRSLIWGPRPCSWTRRRHSLEHGPRDLVGERRFEERIARTGREHRRRSFPVALYGMSLTEVDESYGGVADRYGIPVIEDAAEGFGSRLRRACARVRSANTGCCRSMGIR